MKVILKNLTTLLSILAIIITVSCNNEKQQKKNIVEAQFNVNYQLLHETEFVDSNLMLSLAIPKSFTKSDDSYIKNLENTLIQKNYKQAKIKGVFANTADSSQLIIVDISTMNNAFFKDLKTNYQTVLNQNKLWDQVLYNEFVHNGFRVEQYVMQNPQILHFKLICYDFQNLDEHLIELNYFINKRNYVDNVKAVESSIGSLNFINHKN